MCLSFYFNFKNIWLGFQTSNVANNIPFSKGLWLVETHPGSVRCLAVPCRKYLNTPVAPENILQTPGVSPQEMQFSPWFPYCHGGSESLLLVNTIMFQMSKTQSLFGYIIAVS